MPRAPITPRTARKNELREEVIRQVEVLLNLYPPDRAFDLAQNPESQFPDLKEWLSLENAVRKWADLECGGPKGPRSFWTIMKRLDSRRKGMRLLEFIHGLARKVSQIPMDPWVEMERATARDLRDSRNGMAIKDTIKDVLLRMQTEHDVNNSSVLWFEAMKSFVSPDCWTILKLKKADLPEALREEDRGRAIKEFYKDIQYRHLLWERRYRSVSLWMYGSFLMMQYGDWQAVLGKTWPLGLKKTPAEFKKRQRNFQLRNSKRGIRKQYDEFGDHHRKLDVED